MADSETANINAPLQSEEQQTTEEKSQGGENDLHPRIKQLTEKIHEKDSQIENLQNQLNDLSDKINTRQGKSGDDELTAEEEAALDRIAAGLRKKGVIVTQDDLRQERQAQQYARLSEKYAGGEGEYPKFVPADVQVFAKKKGISDLEDAYFLMHRTAISQVDARRLSKAPTVPTSEKATGKENKTEDKKTLTPQDIANMSDEEYEAQRGNILGSLKPGRSLTE